MVMFAYTILKKLKLCEWVATSLQMSTIIRDFWLSNPQYWIAMGEKRAAIDKLIYDRFRFYDYMKEDDLGKIIYLDQFLRHFSRIEPISESDILASRKEAVRIVECISSDEWAKFSDAELVWYLMPWKHIGEWDRVFRTVHTWLGSRLLTDFSGLNRFYMDTYKKAYDGDAVAAKVMLTSCKSSAYDSARICEVYPAAYGGDRWAFIPVADDAKPLLDALRGVTSRPVAISLSGGVDSMLMTALLAKMKADVVAIHIVYGNRAESPDERNFLAAFCARLGVPLYTYSIEWLRRGHVDRAFYERMTRDLRFHAYKAIGRPVLLGHIQEDVVENIWTNLAHGNNLDNLAKIRLSCMEEGVVLYRPWLDVKKSLIYTTAARLALPYLKNTTPSWSNRGKFRETFHAATVAQYGAFVDEKMLEVAGRLEAQSKLLDLLLFQPIRNSWIEEGECIDVTTAMGIGVDGHSWQRILKEVAHEHLGVGMPGFKACSDFAFRVQRGVTNGQTIRLSKKLAFTFRLKDGKTWLQIV